MKYYVINEELKSSQNGGDYYHVNMCDENLEPCHTYVYPQQANGKKIHNANDWMAVINSHYGVVLLGLKFKNKTKRLINADSIRNADVETFPTKQQLLDYLDLRLN